MQMHYQTLKVLLKKSGSSLTEPRKIVFDLLLNQKPQTMQVLVGRAGNKVDRASVYRTMELFERLGIVNRLNIGWKYKFELSDVFQEHHHHFHCTNCGTTLSLAPNAMLETMIDTVAAKSGHAARGHQLEVSGLCADCKNRAV
jgi:Fur family ferric uptake transcriptional regulator